jgi:hypothetical protein
VLDHVDQHVAASLADLLDDSVVPAASRVQALQLEAQGLAHPSGLQRQRPANELDDRRTDLLGEVTQ